MFWLFKLNRSKVGACGHTRALVEGGLNGSAVSASRNSF